MTEQDEKGGSEYITGSSTTSTESIQTINNSEINKVDTEEIASNLTVDEQKYGINKPTRKIIRAKIIK